MADLAALVEVELAKALRDIDRACTAAAFVEAHLPRGPRGQRAREMAKRARKVRETLLDYGIRLPPLRKIGEFDLPEELETPEESRPPITSPPRPSPPPGPPWTVAGLARLAGVSHTSTYRWALRVGITGNRTLTTAEARAVLRAGGRTTLAEALQGPVGDVK